jgi:hypothetical protein
MPTAAIAVAAAVAVGAHSRLARCRLAAEEGLSRTVHPATTTTTRQVVAVTTAAAVVVVRTRTAIPDGHTPPPRARFRLRRAGRQ